MSDAGVDCDVLVVGAGPGGYVAARRAAQLGLRATVVDVGPLGGTCLNVGCIPSKAVIHAAETFAAVAGADDLAHLGIATSSPTLDLAATMAWKDGIVAKLTTGVGSLLASAGVRCVSGRATIVDGKTVRVATASGEETIRTANLVIATGSQPVELTHLPFGGRVLSSTDVLAVTEVPGRLVVVGAGYIGLELGTAFRKLGADVTVVEVQSRILPVYDGALTRPVQTRLDKLGIHTMLGATAGGLSDDGAALTVTDADGAITSLPVDAVLVTVGRRSLTAGFGLETLDLDMAGHAVAIDDECRTSMRGVYAIGDVTGEPMLAHRASAQGVLVAEVISGLRRSWSGRIVPEVCFTDPEVISVGLSPDAADTAGIDHVSGTFPFAANGRALTLDRPDGFVRVVARRDDHLVLGVQAVGAAVSELAAGCVALIEMGAVLDDVAMIVHPHPQLGEAIHEAALAALGRSRALEHSTSQDPVRPASDRTSGAVRADRGG